MSTSFPIEINKRFCHFPLLRSLVAVLDRTEGGGRGEGVGRGLVIGPMCFLSLCFMIRTCSCQFMSTYILYERIRWKSHLIDVIILAGGVIENGAQPCCHCFNPLTGKWYFMSPLIDSRLNFGLASSHSFLFAVGGSTVGENMSMLSSVERLDPKFNTWEKQSSLREGKPIRADVSYFLCCTRKRDEGEGSAVHRLGKLSVAKKVAGLEVGGDWEGGIVS